MCKICTLCIQTYIICIHISLNHACCVKDDSKHKKPITMGCLGRRSGQGVWEFPGYELFYFLFFSPIGIILNCSLFLCYAKSKKEYEHLCAFLLTF